jgi:hypothetical protein
MTSDLDTLEAIAKRAQDGFGHIEGGGSVFDLALAIDADVVLRLIARVREAEVRKVYQVIEDENDISEGLFLHRADAEEHMGLLQIGYRHSAFRIIERSIIGARK